MLLDAGAHPVVFGVVADGVVLGVHQENLERLDKYLKEEFKNLPQST